RPVGTGLVGLGNTKGSPQKLSEEARAMDEAARAERMGKLARAAAVGGGGARGGAGVSDLVDSPPSPPPSPPPVVEFVPTPVERYRRAMEAELVAADSAERCTGDVASAVAAIPPKEQQGNNGYSASYGFYLPLSDNAMGVPYPMNAKDVGPAFKKRPAIVCDEFPVSTAAIVPPASTVMSDDHDEGPSKETAPPASSSSSSADGGGIIARERGNLEEREAQLKASLKDKKAALNGEG
ncbi:unnamed protein product, partial [Sphacelaria rigidula]